MIKSLPPRKDVGKSPFLAVGGSPWIISCLRRGLVFGMMVWAVLTASALHAQGLAATFNTAADIPVTAASFSASGEVSFTLGFDPTPGTNLTVVKNTGLPFITGQFGNLANGATVNLTHNGTTYPFVAWYYGGEGNNDLMLLWPHTGLAAWGRNEYGQLGDNSRTNRNTPVGVEQSGVLVGKTIVQVARGNSHSLALCSDGTVAAWGYNGNGQLGDNSTTTRRVPVAVNRAAGTSVLAGKTVVTIAAGSYHSLALCSDGTVAAWGYNDDGQLGNSNTMNQSVPVAVDARPTSVLAGKTVVSIAAGSSHNLALCSDGTLVAWGFNSSGQLGDNSTTTRRVPVAVNRAAGTSVLAGKTLVTIAAGSYHNLALCSDGTVAAWGLNSGGQLGDNSTTTRLVPVAVNRGAGTSALAGKTVVALAAGSYHSLALCSDGTVGAWGSNADGQLGNNSTIDSHVPVGTWTISLAGRVVTAIAAGGGHSLVLCGAGTVGAWGSNNNGQLGDNSETTSLMPVVVNVEAGTSVLSGRQASGLAVSSQGFYSIAIYGMESPEIAVEVLEPSVTDLTDQSSAVDFGSVVAAVRTFRVRSTGDAALGILAANLTGADAASFTLLSQPSSGVAGGGSTTFQVAFTAVSPGAKSATLEIASNDRDEAPFRIALAGNKPSAIAVNIAAATDTPLSAPAINLTGVELDVTLHFAPPPGTNLKVVKNTGLSFITGQFSNVPNASTVNLTYQGTIYPFVAWYYGGVRHNELVLLWPHTGLTSWAFNSSGRVGESATTPVGVVQAGALHGKTIVQVIPTGFALCSDGSMASWVPNSYGNSIDGIYSWNVPASVSTQPGLAGKSVVGIADGGGHKVALCSDGTLAAWGFNSLGQVGDNSATNRATPVAVNVAAGTSALAGKKVVSIAAGYSHTLALCSDGTLAAWGSNTFQQLGDGTTWPRYSPVAVNLVALSGKRVVAIATGPYHNLVLCEDGSVVTWGLATYYQSWNHGARLVDLAGKNAISIAAGGDHNLVLCSDGKMYAWGLNTHGQVGDGSLVNRYSPVEVAVGAGLAGKSIIAIAAGQVHSLALYSDGTVASWGANGSSTDDPNRPKYAVPLDISSGTNTLAGKRLAGLSPGSLASKHMAIYGMTSPPAGEIAVTGNGVAISQDDTEPSTADATDFGNAILAGQRVSRSYTIKNQGNITLYLYSPRVSLDWYERNFTLSHAPVYAIEPGGSTRFVLSFEPTLLGPNTSTVTIHSSDHDQPSFSFGIRGFGSLSKGHPQTITFAPPASISLAQGPLKLSAHATSALPVTFSVVPSETTAAGATIVGDVLSFTGTGKVKLQATQAGDAFHAAAPAVVKTIAVTANPPSLTLLNLNQTFTGMPLGITTIGGVGPVNVRYQVEGTFVSDPPFEAGSYHVRATDSTGTLTGTLIIGRAPLYVIPENQSKFVGENNPDLFFSYDGWLTDEQSSEITVPPVARTTATKASVGGQYPITVSGGKPPPNYYFVYRQATLAVYTFAGAYETLVKNDFGAGKLVVTVTASNASFSGRLIWSGHRSALTFSGKLTTDPYYRRIDGTAFATASNPFELSIAIGTDGRLDADLYPRGSTDMRETADGIGRRLLTLPPGKTVSYSGTHTAVVEPLAPTGFEYPKGAGWATAVISTKGVMTLAGRLGDGTAFTSSLAPDDFPDPGYRLFAQPYRTGSATRLDSWVSGDFTMQPHPSPLPALAGRRYVENANLSWNKTGLPKDPTYGEGWGSGNAVLLLDPWLPPVTAKGNTPAIPISTRLSLTDPSFQVLYSTMLDPNLPIRVSLSSTNLVTVTTPSANTTKWKATLTPSTGLFTGSFELADTPTKPRLVPFTGVLRQPATESDVLIGDGHYLLPPLTGTEKTTGEIMFLRP